jgi:hypothetical protein
LEGETIIVNKITLEKLYVKKHKCEYEILEGWVWDGWIPDHPKDPDDGKYKRPSNEEEWDKCAIDYRNFTEWKNISRRCHDAESIKRNFDQLRSEIHNQ